MGGGGLLGQAGRRGRGGGCNPPAPDDRLVGESAREHHHEVLADLGRGGRSEAASEREGERSRGAEGWGGWEGGGPHPKEVKVSHGEHGEPPQAHALVPAPAPAEAQRRERRRSGMSWRQRGGRGRRGELTPSHREVGGAWRHAPGVLEVAPGGGRDEEVPLGEGAPLGDALERGGVGHEEDAPAVGAASEGAGLARGAVDVGAEGPARGGGRGDGHLLALRLRRGEGVGRG